MLTLEFEVKGQRLFMVQSSNPMIVSGTKGYLRIHVSFSSNWNGFKKVVSFYDNKNVEYPVELIDGYCDVPDEVTNSKVFKLRIFGKSRDSIISTSRALVRQVVYNE